MENEEQMYSNPTLQRSETYMGDPDIPMTLDELSHLSKPTLQRSETYVGGPYMGGADIPMTLDEVSHISKPKLKRYSPNSNLFEINHNHIPGPDHSVPLRRERRSDYGMFPEHFEDDVLSWFNSISNGKKAYYIKYLTDSIIQDNPSPCMHPPVEIREPSIFPTNPFSREHDPRPTNRLGASAPKSAFRPPLMRSITSSSRNVSHSPPNIIGSIVSDLDDAYSTDEEFNNTDQLEELEQSHEMEIDAPELEQSHEMEIDVPELEPSLMVLRNHLITKNKTKQKQN